MHGVSERRTAADRLYTDGRCSDLYVKVDRGHILIFHDLLSSYRTPLVSVAFFKTTLYVRPLHLRGTTVFVLHSCY